MLLDIKQDRYFMLDASGWTAINHAISGWPETEKAWATELEGDISKTIDSLRQKRIITPNARDGKIATPISVHVAQSEFDSEQKNLTLPVRSIFIFFVAAVRAKLTLHFQSLEQVVLQARQRRMDRVNFDKTPSTDQVHRLVAIFHRLRLFSFSSKNACLYDSLVLLEYLARHRIFPELVFGVHTRPFAAHCWLQYNDIVLNDTVENVNKYTPIMAI